MCTFDSGTIRVLGILQAGHGERGLYPDIGVFICDTDQHGLVDPFTQPVVDLCVLTQTAQQLVHQLTDPESHSVAAHRVALRQTIFMSEFQTYSQNYCITESSAVDYLQQKVEQEVQKCILLFFILFLLADGRLEAGGKLHHKVNDTFHCWLSGVHDQCVF